MKKTAPPHVANVFRDKLVMCSPTSPDPLVFKFTSAMVTDLEIISHDELSMGIKTFIDTAKLKPGNLLIILHNSVYFEKDYPGPNLPPSQSQEEFIDTIPFSATSAKLFRSGTGYKQIVINRDFYESLKKSFENSGFTVSAVVPGFVLGQEPGEVISAETCRVIYKKMDQITAESFTGFSDPSASFQQKEQMFLKQYQLPVIIISILALIMAIIVVPLTLKTPAKPIKKPAVNVTRPTPTIIPTPVETMSTPSAELLASYTVQILNGSGRAGQAAALSARLREIGLSDIRTGNNPQVSEKSELIFSTQAASAAGEFVLDAVKNLYPEISSATDSQAKFDITIIIGQNTP